MRLIDTDAFKQEVVDMMAILDGTSSDAICKMINTRPTVIEVIGITMETINRFKKNLYIISSLRNSDCVRDIGLRLKAYQEIHMMLEDLTYKI